MAASANRTSIRTARSPARDDLAGTIKRLDEAKDAAAAALRPLHIASDQQEHARRSERDAQAGVAAVDAQEAALVGESWPPPALSSKLKQARRDAEDNLAAAQRVLSTVQGNVESARVPAERAAAAVAEIDKEIDAAIMAVISEEGQAALARLVEARRRAIEAEGAVRSIALTMSSRQWYRAAEQVSTALYEMPRPEASINVGPYVSFIERLAVDADAEVWK